jgi:hypothetical protein
LQILRILILFGSILSNNILLIWVTFVYQVRKLRKNRISIGIDKFSSITSTWNSGFVLLLQCMLMQYFSNSLLNIFTDSTMPWR